MPEQNPYITLNNGVQMPALGLGVYQSSPDDTTAAVDTALRAAWDFPNGGQVEGLVGRFFRLDDQIAALQRLKGGLDSCIGCGCLSLRSCAFSNAGDWAAQQGPGAQLLPDTLRKPHPTRRGSSA